MKRLYRSLAVLSPALLALLPRLGFADSEFYLFPNLTCPDEEALTCWLSQVYQFSQTAILLLSTGVIIIAGIIYTTSAGNPKQIELAKKFIMGALTAVTVIILGKWFLISVIGVPTSWL